MISRLNSRFEAASSTVRWLKRLDEFFQVGGGLPRAAMRFLDRGDRHGKENSRLFDERGAFAGRAARQYFRDQDLLVEFGQVQRLQPGGQRLAAQIRAPTPGWRAGPASGASAMRPDSVATN